MKKTPLPSQIPTGKIPEGSSLQDESATPVRRPYQRPSITAHGPMVRIALGGTPGVGDSGSPATQQPLG